MDAHLTARAIRYAAYGAGALVLLVVTLALVAPLFLDTPAVERELQAKLSQLVRGEVEWEQLSIRLLPSPRGALSKVRVEIPGVAEVRAEQVNAHLRLLPLFRGSAEIAEVSLSKPVVRLKVARSASSEKKARDEPKAGPVERYRAVVDAIRELAPDSEVAVVDGEVDVGLPDLPPLRLRKLQLQGRTDSKGMALELAAASDDWSSFRLAVNVVFADYSGAAKAEIASARAQPWLDRFLASSPVGVALPEANLRVGARTDGKTALDGDLELRSPMVEIMREAARVQVADVAIVAKAAVRDKELAVSVASVQLGASRLASGNVRYGFENRALAVSTEFDLDLAQAMDATRRLVPEDAAKALERIQPVSGRAQGRAKFEMRSAWNAVIDIEKSDSAVGIEGLPGPVKLASGQLSLARDAVKVERADVSLLDARAVASANIGYGKQLRIDGAASDGSVGEGALAWIWKTAGAPPKVVLKTPVRIGVQRASWGPGQALDVTATASFDAGPGVGVELGWTPKALDIRRATIKDANSDAVLALRLEKGLAQGRFSGSLQSTTIGGALRDAKVPSGGASGDLRFRVDLAHPEQGTATGTLKADTVDLAWLLGHPLTVERVDAEANGQKLLIREASVNWADQRFALSGTLARAADGAPVIDAKLDSPGVRVDALLPPKDTKEPAPAPKNKDEGEGALWTRWPLPLRGHVDLRAGFIQYGERKAEPVVATLTLEEQKTNLELKEVQLCGISLPLTVAGTAEGLDIAVHLTARKQQLEQTARCMTERGVLITGEFDLDADLRTRGRPKDLVSNLEGTVSAGSRDGRVMKFALLGNILSLSDVSSALKQSGPKLDEKGFPYRTLTARGRFERGTFVIDESGFSSDAVGLAATGHISLVDYKSQLTVLVAPFERVDRLVRGVPLVGYLVGGVLTSIPVGVSGDIRDPLVVPLGPGAVTSELKGVFERTITLPAKLVPQ
jgi:hypothetical protein